MAFLCVLGGSLAYLDGGLVNFLGDNLASLSSGGFLNALGGSLAILMVALSPFVGVFVVPLVAALPPLMVACLP